MVSRSAPRDEDLVELRAPEISPRDEATLDVLLAADVNVKVDRLDELTSREDEALDRLLEDVD